MRKTAQPAPSASPTKQLAGFLAKFDPAMAKRIRAVRAALRKRLPTAIELVYDNYNFFVIGYSATERASDAIVSLAANAHGVGLAFIYGATLPDPLKLLQGSGSQNRFIRLESAGTLGGAGSRGADPRRGRAGQNAAREERRGRHRDQVGVEATAAA